MKSLFWKVGGIIAAVTLLGASCPPEANLSSASMSNVPVPEAVDLGLTVKWASCNLGASAPEEFGFYYAWGELEPTTEYSWFNYKWASDISELTKYCTKYGTWTGRGRCDNKLVLDLNDDAAHAALGGKWRMPTEAEMEEMFEFCSFEWTVQNGVAGVKVTSEDAEGILFFPAAGSYLEDQLSGVGVEGGYWSSTLDESDPASAYYLILNPEYAAGVNMTIRPAGLCIRPVLAE